MTAIVRAIRGGWGWLQRYGIVGDVRSAIVGSAVAAVISTLIAWHYEPGPPKEIEIRINSDGLASPMAALIAEAQKDVDPTAFSFEPPAFKDVWVCEYSHLTGYSGREMMLAYLSKYSMCFSVVQTADRVYSIRPNPNVTPEFRKDGDAWFCRCK
jgi:hypothetical protein